MTSRPKGLQDLLFREGTQVCLGFGAFLLVYGGLYLAFRNPVLSHLAFAPVAFGAWRLGARAGWMGFLFALGIVAVSMHLWPPVAPGLHAKSILGGAGGLALMTGVVLWARRLTTRLSREVAERCEVEAALRAQQEEVQRLLETQGEELARLQERLGHAEKMRSIGVMAGGLAHDFNNMLTTIYGFSELILLKHPATDGCTEPARQIHQAASHARDLTRQLLGFAREGAPEARRQDFHALLHEAAGLLRHSLGRKVDLQLELEPGDAFVQGEGGALQSVVFNLALNARDAMPEGGTLRLGTQRIDLRQSRELGSGVCLLPGPYLRLDVEDTGHGMEPATLARIFEPFFTTKPLGKGTGLGLPAAATVLHRHGGGMDVASVPGEGTCISVFLPLQEVPAQAVGPEATLEEEWLGLKVLVLGQNLAMMSLLQSMLDSLGCEVTVAHQLEVSRGLVEGAQWVICVPQGIDPLEDGCVRRIREWHPKVQIAVAGLSPGETDVEAYAEAGVARLDAPFSLGELVRILRKASLAA